MGAAMGWVAFCASPTYRRRFLENSARAGYSFGAVRAAVAHAGRMVAELPRLWLGAPLPCGMVGEACVEQAYAAGRGIVFLTPHQGCFELSAQAAARHWSAERGPITVLYRPARQPWLARVMETARNRPGMLAVPTTLSGVRQMIKAFGRDAYTMTLATHFEPLPAPLDERLESAVLQINQAMEHLIRQCPEQYLWGYARYKQPRAEATPGGAA